MRLNVPTKICKLCFKDIKDISLVNLINPDIELCKRCYQNIRPKFKKFDVSGCKGLSIYEYDEKIQSLLYQFKGCFDIELKNLFFDRYINVLNLFYRGYIMVPIPSYEVDDAIREFNHVEEMFSKLKIPKLKLIKKTKGIKQASSNFDKRKEISKYLELTDSSPLIGKKILIVDDVYTTGSTMKAAIKLIRELHPKKIKVLVMSKTLNKDEKK